MSRPSDTTVPASSRPACAALPVASASRFVPICSGRTASCFGNAASRPASSSSATMAAIESVSRCCVAASVLSCRWATGKSSSGSRPGCRANSRVNWSVSCCWAALATASPSAACPAAASCLSPATRSTSVARDANVGSRVAALRIMLASAAAGNRSANCRTSSTTRISNKSNEFFSATRLQTVRRAISWRVAAAISVGVRGVEVCVRGGGDVAVTGQPPTAGGSCRSRAVCQSGGRLLAERNRLTPATSPSRNMLKPAVGQFSQSSSAAASSARFTASAAKSAATEGTCSAD